MMTTFTFNIMWRTAVLFPNTRLKKPFYWSRVWQPSPLRTGQNWFWFSRASIPSSNTGSPASPPAWSTNGSEAGFRLSEFSLARKHFVWFYEEGISIKSKYAFNKFQQVWIRFSVSTYDFNQWIIILALDHTNVLRQIFSSSRPDVEAWSSGLANTSRWSAAAQGTPSVGRITERNERNKVNIIWGFVPKGKSRNVLHWFVSELHLQPTSSEHSVMSPSVTPDASQRLTSAHPVVTTLCICRPANRALCVCVCVCV